MNSHNITKAIADERGTIISDKLYLRTTDFVDHQVVRAIIRVLEAVANDSSKSQIITKCQEALSVVAEHQSIFTERMSKIAEINTVETRIEELEQQLNEALAEEAEAQLERETLEG